MPTERENALAAAEPMEPERPVGADEKVDFDEDNDPEETMEEEYEYEEVEEEEEEEIIEEEVEEEVEGEEEDDTNDAPDAGNSASRDGMKIEDEDEKRKHAELLALPPHGSEVYIGGISHDASEDDLRGFCESVGEVTEVISIFMYKVLCCLLFVNNWTHPISSGNRSEL